MAQRIDINEIVDADAAYQYARRMSRHSCYDWIAWTRRDGQQRCARLCVTTIKQAMLDVGTQGHVFCYAAYGSEPSTRWNWWIANNVRRQLKRGM